MIKYGAEFKPVAIMMLNVFDHLAIMNVDYGIDDYVEVCMVRGGYRTRITKCKIDYGERPSFTKFGRKYYIDDFMRVDYGRGGVVD